MEAFSYTSNRWHFRGMSALSGVFGEIASGTSSANGARKPFVCWSAILALPRESDFRVCCNALLHEFFRARNTYGFFRPRRPNDACRGGAVGGERCR